MHETIDLIGQKFGRLLVVERVESDKSGNHRWLCECVCKNEMIVRGDNLKSGHTQSCGCFKIEKATKHGHTKNGKSDRFYRSWLDMIQRCTNPNNTHWQDYGGREITVCKRWMKFENFLEDMLKEWKLGLTLERRKNELGYCKDNCHWATRREQARNTRRNRYETYEGKRWLFVELCEEFNMPYKIVYNRYYILGWTLKESLTTPIGQRRKKHE